MSLGETRSLAAAWSIELKEHGLGPSMATDKDVAVGQHLFYAGAAAMIAMVMATGPDKHALLELYASVKAELEEYLGDLDT